MKLSCAIETVNCMCVCALCVLEHATVMLLHQQMHAQLVEIWQVGNGVHTYIHTYIHKYTYHIRTLVHCIHMYTVYTCLGVVR